MKKLIFALISLTALGSFNVYSQQANRKGIFAELQGGNTFGYVYKANIEGGESGKGGMDLGFSIGYRIAPSLHWAYQAKAMLTINPSFEKIISPSLLVGVRWTSNDFAGDKSIFLGLNTGCGVVPGYIEGWYIPIDFEIGCNLSPKFGIGLYVMPKIFLGGVYDVESIWSGYYEQNYCTNTIVGLRLNYRF